MSKRVRVKMCGMMRSEDVDFAVALGVDALGFVFYEQSTRYITIDEVANLLVDIPPFITLTAVLVNPSPELVWRIIKELPINLLQFHGDETPEFCQSFPLPYIKMLNPYPTVKMSSELHRFNSAQAILFDTPSQSIRGGSGCTFDWSMIPKGITKPYLVAGGLNEFNVQDALRTSAPYGVDVCSGVEAMPGIKDHIKMSRFVAALWGDHYE